MPRHFIGPDHQDWSLLDDGAALVRSDRLHAVASVRGSLAPHDATPPMTDPELTAFVGQWTAKRRNESQYQFMRGFRWATSPNGSETVVDMVRFGALLTAPGVTVWRAALPGEMAAPLIVRLGEEPIALVAPLED